MSSAPKPRHGGDLLIESLIALGATTSFGVPGESYLAALDAMYESDHRFILCRHEGGASFMAAAWGKLTGQPGICFVTRGPGATNAAIGVHTARQDSVPMILFVGQVATHQKGREAFQEVDYVETFSGFAKWVVEVNQIERLPELLARAWVTAQTGRPGPVVVVLPEDVLSAPTNLPALGPLRLPAPPHPDESAVAEALSRLTNAKRPLILVAGANWTAAGRMALKGFAEASDIPIICAFRCHDVIDNTSPAFAGEAGVAMKPEVRKTIEEADVVLALNLRFGEMVTDAWRLFDVPNPQKKLIHVHASADEIGKIYQPALGILADHNAFAQQLQPLENNWSEWRETARDRYVKSFERAPQTKPVDMRAVTQLVQSMVPDDVIITHGAGNFAAWADKYFTYGTDARLLAPQSGAMGYGVPAAIAASLAAPEKVVVCIAGDGDFQMTCQELATARQFGAKPIILIVNNGRYGTIRSHQDKHYPGRVSGTNMVSPDFVAFAQAYGFDGYEVTSTAAFEAAFTSALQTQNGAVIDLKIVDQ